MTYCSLVEEGVKQCAPSSTMNTVLRLMLSNATCELLTVHRTLGGGME